jgi:flagellar biosynthesis protein FlhF
LINAMEVKSFRARSMQEALQQVRHTLGPDAAVLQTREVRRGLVQWLTGSREFEVLASADVQVPSRLPQTTRPVAVPRCSPRAPLGGDFAVPQDPLAPADQYDFRARFRAAAKEGLSDQHSLIEDLSERPSRAASYALPETLCRVFTELVDAEIDEALARDLIDRVRRETSPRDLDDRLLLKARIAAMIEETMGVCGPLQVRPTETRLVALVGPTGVGKTTTVAKLAANYRLRERRRVGLITVDTYRMAAVEQLRTYADIMDLPMEVVSTPREIREAVDRFSGLELILMDTAGRSPSDEVRIQELKSLLTEARADEVHLVLSSVASSTSLIWTAEQFLPVGVTALLLTKLDEASGLGNLLPLIRSLRLPLSYVTNGQNVPDDLEPADAGKLTEAILGTQYG